MRRRHLLVLALSARLAPLSASAQDVREPHSRAPSFWITEAGYAHSLSGTCADHYPSFEVGKLWNRDSSLALGGTFFIGHNEDVVFGPVPRLRYWASEDIGLDLSGGLLFGGSRTRPMGYVSLNYRDLLAGFVQYERYRDGGCGAATENQLFVGVKLGSRPGLITAAVGSAVAAIIIVSVVSQVEN